jgi:hypothetical protein
LPTASASSVEKLIRPLKIALEQLLEARFVDRHRPATQLLDLVSVLIGAGDVPAELGKTGSGDKADIARPDHADVHELCP